MLNIHPKLIESLVIQTPRAMIALLIVSLAYIWVFIDFIPLPILILWLIFQLVLVIYRFHNIKMFKKYLEEKNQTQVQKHKFYFIISNFFQAFTWTLSSVLVFIYAPQPFELVSFVMMIGIITAAALSMSSLYSAYLIFFFLMIIPQIIIMLYYGELQHIALVIFTIIYIPATILLSKVIYNSLLSNIKANDELKESVEKLHKLAIIDNLTNIYNQRYFFEMSQNLISIANRENQKLSLLMLDVDYFKNINDTFGHQGGDFILKNIVKEIEKTMRKSDIFARIGGEEFAILLNDTSIEGARIIAEKIRSNIEKKVFIYNKNPISLTISIGISQLCEENNSIEELYKQSDKQLYIAKEKGRNLVVS